MSSSPVVFDGTNFTEIQAAAGDRYAGPAVIIRNDGDGEVVLRPGWVIEPGGGGIWSAEAWRRKRAEAA